MMRFLHVLLLATPLLAGENVVAARQNKQVQPGQTTSNYTPMTNEERWNYYARENFGSPGAIFRSAFPAAMRHLNDEPPEWGQGASGYGRRLASQAAMRTFGGTVEHGTAYIFGLDPRYEPCACKGFFPRFGHALLSNFVTRTNSGGRSFNVPNIAGSYSGAFLSMTWHPERYSWKDGFREGSQRLMIGGSFNVFREFWPEIKRIVPFAK